MTLAADKPHPSPFIQLMILWFTATPKEPDIIIADLRRRVEAKARAKP